MIPKAIPQRRDFENRLRTCRQSVKSVPPSWYEGSFVEFEAYFSSSGLQPTHYTVWR